MPRAHERQVIGRVELREQALIPHRDQRHDGQRDPDEGKAAGIEEPAPSAGEQIHRGARRYTDHTIRGTFMKTST